LKALTQNDEALLFGRAEVIGEIVGNCRAERVTVVTSEPGLGVTSLLDAGVAPALRREGLIVVTFRDWQGRFFASNLRDALAEAAREADPLFFAEAAPLDQMLKGIRQRCGKPIAVLLDQFEDYLRGHVNTEISAEFDAELAHAIGSREGLFVIGMQEYAIPALERMKQHIANLLGYQVRLAPLSVEAGKEIVIAEARRMALDVEPDAIAAIVTAPVIARGDNGVHPYFLNVATEQLLDAEKRMKSHALRMAVIEARHGVDRVVLESLDPTIGEFGKTHMELLFRWCNILISPEKHRLSVTEKGLTDYAGKLNRFVLTLLPLLTRTGILRHFQAPDAIRYEISRDCLTLILRDWWERREAALVARRRALFRIRSVSVAGSAIILMYVIWLIFGTSEPR
jgi:hypothetical protein